MRYINLSEFARKPNLLKKLIPEDPCEKIVIIKNTEAVAVVLGIMEYRSLMALARVANDALRDPDGFKDMLKSHRDFQSGKACNAPELDEIDWESPNPPQPKSDDE